MFVFVLKTESCKRRLTCSRVETPTGASSWLLQQIQTAGTTQSKWLKNYVDIK